MSKDVKPRQRIGQKHSWKKKLLSWTVLLLVMGGGGYAAYHYTAVTTKVEVPVVKVRKAEFVISVRTRGEMKSVRSVVLAAPQVPQPRIVHLANSGQFVKKGDVVVEFDPATQEQNFLDRTNNVKSVDSEIVQTKASHTMTNEADGMNLLSSEYNLQRSKLDASKADVVSEIEGAKSQIDVGVSEGALGQVNTTVASHKVTQSADLSRLNQKKDKAVRDLDKATSYLSMMQIRAPIDGIVNILPNARSNGSFGSSPPAFKEGDSVWTGAAIAEIPDLSSMRINLNLDEVDRGRLQLGQKAKIRVDALPEKEFAAKLDWISPIAQVNFRGLASGDKQFPAQATLESLDPRLRPGMSASAEVVIESQPDQILIPSRASFTSNGKPVVYVQQGEKFVMRQIEIGKRNETEIVVLKGLTVGEQIALENPIEAAKKAKKR